jgi:acyl carrier protein
MKKQEIEVLVMTVLRDFCDSNNISAEIDSHTPLLGANKILDSMGLVNVIVDIETAFLDENIEISLTSEAAMSGRISPFRTVGALCRFISQQLGIESNE